MTYSGRPTSHGRDERLPRDRLVIVGEADSGMINASNGTYRIEEATHLIAGVSDRDNGVRFVVEFPVLSSRFYTT